MRAMSGRLPLILAASLLCASGARAAQSLYPVHIERQHGSTLVIEHTPVLPILGVRRIHRAKIVVRKHRVHRIARAGIRHKHHRRTVVVRHKLRHDPALAGGCHDGGFVERVVAGGALVTLHRDVCEGIAPISSIR
jgi:hypothetical protein